MKSIIITILMFALILLAVHFNVFEVMSSGYMYAFSFILVIIVLIIALKVLGNPFKYKDNDHDSK